MPPPSTLDKNQRKDLLAYLENAHGTNMGVPDWNTNWTPCHGEGRSAAATTFHIAVQLTSAGDHKTHIKFGHKVLAGSEVNWKAKRPSLQRVLNTYKTKYGAEITTSESSSNNEEGNPGNAWQNKIMKANDGTFFYLDEDDVYHACNEAGEDL